MKTVGILTDRVALFEVHRTYCFTFSQSPHVMSVGLMHTAVDSCGLAFLLLRITSLGGCFQLQVGKVSSLGSYKWPRSEHFCIYLLHVLYGRGNWTHPIHLGRHLNGIKIHPRVHSTSWAGEPWQSLLSTVPGFNGFSWAADTLHSPRTTCELSCGTVYPVLADRSCFIRQVPKLNKTKPPNNNKNVVTSSKNY